MRMFDGEQVTHPLSTSVHRHKQWLIHTKVTTKHGLFFLNPPHPQVCLFLTLEPQRRVGVWCYGWPCLSLSDCCPRCCSALLFFIMCHQQMRTLIFVLWVLAYIAFLLSARRMWTGKYVRSPLARLVLLNVLGENEAPEIEEVWIHQQAFGMHACMHAAGLSCRGRGWRGSRDVHKRSPS